LLKFHIVKSVAAEKSKNKRRTKESFIIGKKRKWMLKRCDLIVKKERVGKIRNDDEKRKNGDHFSSTGR